jgi:PST family polysaccharide transporter
MAVVESIVFAIVMLAAFRTHATSSRLGFSWSHARMLLHHCMPFMIANLATLVCLRADQVLLRQLANAQQSGLYAAILPITEGFYVISTSVATTLLPIFSGLLTTNPARFQRLFARLLWGIVMLGSAIALTISLGAERFVQLLLGDPYAAAAEVLRLHIWTVVFVFLGVVENIWIVLHNRGAAKLYKTLFGAIVNIGLNFALIPHWGARGAALASVASFFCASYLSNAAFAPPLFKMQSRLLLPWNWTTLWRA